MATLLTIDWDFFIQNRGEGDPSGNTVFPDGKECSNWLMFDWGAFEGHGPTIGSLLWLTRASHWLRCGLDIRQDLAILPDRGCVMPATFSQIIEERFPDLSAVEKFAGDSHAWAISVVRYLSEMHGPIEVVSFDAHCDLGYSEEKVAKETKKGQADCGSWLYHGLEKEWVKSVEIVYPDWKRMVEWEQASSEPFLQPYLNRVTARTWSDWLAQGRSYDDLEAVNLCRSSGWTPPWLDEEFLNLRDLISDDWVNLDDEIENPFGGGSIGGYDAFEPRVFDWESVANDAAKIEAFMNKKPSNQENPMPSRPHLIEMVANQMMKGPKPGQNPASAQEKERFIKRHSENIDWVLTRLPRASCAVGAVTMKCLIKYGREPVEKWCDALKNQNFNGHDDPALLLWTFLLKHKGRNTLDVHQKTLCAAKNYMEGTKVRQLRPYREDIFQWDADWTIPDEYIDKYENPETVLS